MDKTNRLFKIIYLLQAEGRLTAGELAARLEVSERTVRRDVETLLASGVPVRVERGHGGGISLMDDAHLTSALLTPEEREQVVLGVKAMTQLRAGSSASSALTKLTGAFASGGPCPIDVDLCPWHDGREPVKWLAELQQAVRERRCVALEYAGAGGATAELVVEPVRLVNENRAWHLEAWCRSCRRLRAFRLSRIRSAHVLAEVFAWGARHEGVAESPLLEEMPDQREEHLELEVSPAAAWRALDFFRPDEYQMLDDGSVRVSTRILHYDWVLGLLVQFGADARVVEPAGLRELLVTRSREICAAYADADVASNPSAAPVPDAGVASNPSVAPNPGASPVPDASATSSPSATPDPGAAASPQASSSIVENL